ncbi:MAG: helix-turn-helix domain-containing protein [Flavobacteriales bacterium]
MPKISRTALLKARKELGDHLRELRLRRGLSQVQLAASLRIRAADVSNAENGISNCGIDTITRIMKGLGYSRMVLVKR